MVTRSVCVLLFAVMFSCAVRADVALEGVEGDVAEAVRAGLSLPDDCDAPRWLVRFRFRSSQREIETTLATFGYYSSSIDASLTFDDTCWRAGFAIDTGPPAIIEAAHISIEGDGRDFEPFDRVLQASVVREGARFDHSAYESLKDELESVAARYGFLEGQFAAHRVEVDADENRVTVRLVYRSGPRFRFGEIRFVGDGLDDDVLERYLPFESGDPYDADKLGDLYQALLSSGYFDDAVIDTSEVEGTQVNVEVTPVIGRASISRVGIGYSTDLGPALFASRDRKLVNRRGHQLKLDLSVSPVKSEVGGYYRIPRSEHRNGWLSLYGGYLLEDTGTAITRKSTLGIREIRPRGGGWVETRFFEVVNDQFDVAGETQSNISFVPGISFSHSRISGSSARPARGHRLDFRMSGTDHRLGSTLDYFKVSASGKAIHSLGDRLRVIGRARIGAVFSDVFEKLPADVRFFSGGDEKVRGFDFEEIGVINDDGSVIGGDRLTEFSAELDYAVRPKWAAAVFVDAGSVSLSSFSGEYERSVGIGVRWYSPIGPVRFDIARPLDRPDKSVRIHISLGPDL